MPRLRLDWILSAARRRPGPLPLAAGLSLALHGAALAAALWIGTGTPPAHLPMHTVPMVIIEAPPASGGAAEAAPSPPAAVAPHVARTEPEPPEPPAPAERSAEAVPSPQPPPAPDALAATVPEQAAPAPQFAPPPRKPEPPASEPVQKAPSAPARVAQESAPPPPQAAARAPDGDQAKNPPGGDAERVTPPRYGLAGLSNPPPDYPWLARRNGEQGRVVVRVRVDETGRARDVEVARTSGHARLDRAALETLRSWRFAPAERGGRAAPGTVEVPVTFRLTAN